jgi:cell division initiation protein
MPDTIRAWAFSRIPLGRRGLNEREVEQFRDRMADEVDGWIDENAALRAENDRLKTALRQWQSEQASGRIGPRFRGGTAGKGSAAQVSLLNVVLQEAEAVLAREHTYSKRMTDHARAQYEGVLREAERHAVEEAERAVHAYRNRSGGRYAAEFEELERRLAWVTSFVSTVQAVEDQLKAAREALTLEVQQLSALDQQRNQDRG